MVLWEEKEVKIKDLGERLYLDTGTLTPLLKKMEEGGLLKRERSISDERVVNVSITKKGMELREKSLAIPKKVGSCINLSPKEMEILISMLHKLFTF